MHRVKAAFWNLPYEAEKEESINHVAAFSHCPVICRVGGTGTRTKKTKKKGWFHWPSDPANEHWTWGLKVGKVEGILSPCVTIFLAGKAVEGLEMEIRPRIPGLRQRMQYINNSNYNYYCTISLYFITMYNNICHFIISLYYIIIYIYNIQYLKYIIYLVSKAFTNYIEIIIKTIYTLNLFKTID